MEGAEDAQLPPSSVLLSQLWGSSLTEDNYNAVLDRFNFRPGHEPTAGAASRGFATWERTVQLVKEQG